MLEQVSLAASAVIAARSSRERGYSGLAQSQGHRTPATLIQQVSGVTRGEAMRQRRVGSALIDAENALRLEIANEGGGPRSLGRRTRSLRGQAPGMHR